MFIRNCISVGQIVALSFGLASVASAQDGGYGPPTEAPVAPEAVEKADSIKFKLTPSAGVTACLPYASGEVKIVSEGPVEVMDVWLSGLPKDAVFELFVTQLADFPFGLSWYQGDMETDAYGKAHGRFIGRFNLETFTVAVGQPAPAPVVHSDSPNKDADTNPVTAPVHMFHLGLWFDSPEVAAAAGCPGAVTPFNGEHDAGVQVLNSASFPPDAGPLSQIQ